MVIISNVLTQGLKERGYTLQDNEAEQLVSHLDTDTNGTVDYLDWLAAMVDWHKVIFHPSSSWTRLACLVTKLLLEDMHMHIILFTVTEVLCTQSVAVHDAAGHAAITSAYCSLTGVAVCEWSSPHQLLLFS